MNRISATYLSAICCAVLMGWPSTGFASAMNSGVGVAGLLKPSPDMKTVTLKEAFDEALKRHTKLLLAENQLAQRRVDNAMRIAAILPKLRMGSAYTRNIPEVETNPFAQDSQALTRHVATLYRDAKKNDVAEELERQADFMARRQADSKIVLSPKHAFDSKLSLEVPLFNGPDIARIMASNETVSLSEARVRDEESKTIFDTAKAYFSALHLRNVLLLREQAEQAAEESFLKAEAAKKRGVLIEKDYLYAHASYLQKQAERRGSLIDYRTAIARLGGFLGRTEEFEVNDPDQLFFAPLNDDAEKLIELALNNRADIIAERQALRVVESERFGQFLQFLPTFSLLGDAKYTSNERGLLGKNFTYAITINANVSLFDGGMSIAQLRGNSLRRQESEIRMRELKLDVNAKIRGHKERLQFLAMLEAASMRMAEAARESEHVAISRHKRGLIDLEELLEASDKKLNAEIALRKAQSDNNEEKLALIFQAGLLTRQFVQ